MGPFRSLTPPRVGEIGILVCSKADCHQQPRSSVDFRRCLRLGPDADRPSVQDEEEPRG